MSEHSDEIRSAVSNMLAQKVIDTGTAKETWDRKTWGALTESGFTELGVPEHLGGSGGDLSDVVDVVATLANHGASTPIIEHALAGWLVSSAAVQVPKGVGTVAVGSAAELTVIEVDGSIWVDGRLTAVPWASEASWLAVAVDSSECTVVIIDLSDDGVRVAEGTDMVGAPLCDVVLKNVPSQQFSLNTLLGIDTHRLEMRGALLYAAATAAAASAVSTLTVDYVSGRSQFGRPLAKFQAVQQRVSSLASRTVEMERAVRVATAACATDDESAFAAVASAKTVVSGHVREVAAAGHQLHGAIGFTSEYRLGRFTGSMHSWRSRWGSEADWSRALASMILDRGCGVWELVTGQADRTEGVVV